MTVAERSPDRVSPLNSHWDGRPEEYDRLRDCWLNERRLEYIDEQLGRLALPAGAHVLEIGAGTGWLLRRLASRRPDLSFTGIEPDESYVTYANASAAPNERHLALTAEDLTPASMPRFSVVLSNDVLHHVASIPDVFAAVGKVSVPGCLWLSIEPNFLNPYSFLKQHFGYGERVFYPRTALDDARRGGWRLEGRDNLFLLPPFLRTPPSWARALERRFEHNPVLGGGLVLRLRRR